MIKFTYHGLMLVFGIGLAVPASAETVAIDMKRSCQQAFAVDDQSSLANYVIWADGFITARGGATVAMTQSAIQSRLGLLKAACAANPNASVLQIVQSMAGGRPTSAKQISTKSFPPTDGGARALLQQFFVSGADLAALTATLRPAPNDYRVVYKEPFASALEKTHSAMWKGRPAIRPKEGQTELLMFYASTTDLIARKKALEVFPGGYKQVVPHMKPNIPIVRFKFVKPGERLGLAFDGLVYVNGRWLLMPKPYRAL